MDLLKLYIYGYLNRVRSSRRLEAETHRNIEVIWLLRHLKPDFKRAATASDRFSQSELHGSENSLRPRSRSCRGPRCTSCRILPRHTPRRKPLNTTFHTVCEKYVQPYNGWLIYSAAESKFQGRSEIDRLSGRNR